MKQNLLKWISCWQSSKRLPMHIESPLSACDFSFEGDDLTFLLNGFMAHDNDKGHICKTDWFLWILVQLSPKTKMFNMGLCVVYWFTLQSTVSMSDVVVVLSISIIQSDNAPKWRTCRGHHRVRVSQTCGIFHIGVHELTTFLVWTDWLGVDLGFTWLQLETL